MVRPFIFPALTIWGTRGTLVLCLYGRQPFLLHRSSGGVALCEARGFAAPAAGAKRKDNLRFSFLFELLPFPC